MFNLHLTNKPTMKSDFEKFAEARENLFNEIVKKLRIDKMVEFLNKILISQKILGHLRCYAFVVFMALMFVNKTLFGFILLLACACFAVVFILICEAVKNFFPEDEEKHDIQN